MLRSGRLIARLISRSPRQALVSPVFTFAPPTARQLSISARIRSEMADQSNAQQIVALLEEAEAKFAKLKSVFVEAETKKLDAEQAKLKKEVENLKAELTKKEKAAGIPVVAHPPSNLNADASNGTPAPAEEKPAEKPAGEPKEPKGKKQKGGDAKPKAAPAAAAADDAVDVGRLDLRVGRIVDAKKHPDADALYVETIDLGEEKPRTVISGLVKHVPLDQMLNRLVVCLCNLKPVKMRGIESQAMVMCASSPDKVEIMEVAADAKPGDRVLVDGFAHRPDAQLNPKKKVWETVAVDLKVSADGRAVYKDAVLLVEGKTPMTAATLRDVPVK